MRCEKKSISQKAAKKIGMNNTVSRMAVIAVLLLTCLFVIPVSAADSGNATAPDAKQLISASVSSVTPVVGDPVTISGVEIGGNLTAGVQIWIFAGNYIDVSNVPVDAEGKFSKTYNTTGLPPAIYYVIVQSPFTDGIYDIDAIDVNGFSSQVVNTKTGKTIFNFTGTGSVQDKAAVAALSEAFNQPGVDDIYTKLEFTLVAPSAPAAGTTTEAIMTPNQAVPAQTSAKSPLSLFTVFAGIGAAAFAIGMMRRQ